MKEVGNFGDIGVQLQEPTTTLQGPEGFELLVILLIRNLVYTGRVSALWFEEETKKNRCDQSRNPYNLQAITR